MLKSIAVMSLLLICVFVQVGQVKGQPVKEFTSEQNVYHVALKAYLEENEKRYSKLFPDKDFRSIILVYDPIITEGIPGQIGPYSIRQLKFADLLGMIEEKTIKQSNYKAEVIEIRPIRFRNSQMLLSIVESYAEKDDARLSLSISDEAVLTIRFDCTKNIFYVEKIDFFGL